MNDKERRAATRHAATVAAELQSGETLGVVHNISTTGALLLTRRALEPGDDVAIALVFSGDGKTSTRHISAEVVRSAKRNAESAVLWRYETAVAFSEPLTEAEQDLAAIANGQASFRGN